MAAVWGEHPTAHARATLQVYVANLRKLLDSDGPTRGARRLQRQPGGYVLNFLPGDELDVHRFRALTRKAQRLLAEDPSSAAPLLRSALESWRGAPFPDLTNGASPDVGIAALEEERLVALADRIQADIDSRVDAELVAELEQLVAAHPLRERFHAFLIVARYRAGRQADALDAYRRAQQLLLKELGIRPGPELQRLERAVLEQDPALMSVVPAARARPTLPETPTALIGRQTERASIVSFLRGDVRLVTLTGPPGTGKTRLAIEAAKALQPDFPAGVFFVALGSVNDPAMVLSTVAAAVNVRETERPLFMLLCDRLDGQRALLIVDNLEHLMPAADHLSDLLTHTRELKILVTSRAAMRTPAEQAYQLDPLPLPPLNPPPSVDELRYNDAVVLFRDRARAVLPHFDLDEENAAAVAAICRHLDGLPLAIELAAARIRVLSPSAILQRLDARLRLLTTGAQDMPRRQQTLRNTIEWSYELLNLDQRKFFARLGVFAGSCELEAAEAVCPDPGEQAEARQRLQALESQSLVQIQQSTTGAPRITILATVHAYSRELLESSGDLSRLRREHARYYAALAECAAPHLLGGDQAKWMSRLSDELDNLRAALDWATAPENDHSLALRMASALWPFWEMAGLLHEGRRWLSAVLAHVDSSPAVLLLHAYSGAGTFAWALGDDEEALDLHTRALDLARHLGDRQEEAFALNNLASVHFDRHELTAAELLYGQAATLATEANARRIHGMIVHNMAELHFHRGQLERAARHYEDAIGMFRETGDQWSLNGSLHGLAMTRLRQGDEDRAVQALRQSLGLAAQLGENSWVAENLEALAAVAQHAKRPKEAARLLGASMSLRARIGTPVQPANRADLEALTVQVRSELTDDAFQAAWGEGQQMAVSAIVHKALEGGVQSSSPF